MHPGDWIRMRFRKPFLPGFGCSEGVWVALNGLEVMRPFWAKLTTVYGNHDDRALPLDTRSKSDHQMVQ